MPEDEPSDGFREAAAEFEALDIEPQSEIAPRFRRLADGRIDVDADAGRDRLLDDEIARDCHAAALAMAQVFLEATDRSNSAARQRRQVNLYLAALGQSPRQGSRPHLMVLYGQSLRHALAADQRRREAPDLLEEPLEPAAWAALADVVAAHDQYADYDPTLAAIERAHLGPDRPPLHVSDPEVALTSVTGLVDRDIATAAVGAVVETAAEQAQVERPSLERLKVRFAETVGNAWRVTLGSVRWIVAKSVQGTLDLGGAFVGGLGDGFGTEQKRMVFLRLIVEHEAFLLELFDANPRLKTLIKKLVLEARKLTEPDVPPPLDRPPEPLPNLHILRDGTPAPELVVIPAGSFLMGSPKGEEGRYDDEGPQHRVSVQRFALGRYAVTFEEYDLYCVAKRVERPGDEGWGRGRRPAINVSWNDAQRFCTWLSSETGKVYRLPSEAEWEYACRAGTVTRYSWGDAFDERLANNNREKTTEVGSFPANPWKLFDMHGNVWEWCEDDWHNSYDHHPGDGRSWVEEPRKGQRVLRGGSWSTNPGDLRSAQRIGLGPGDREDWLGFRVARALTP